MTRLSVVPGISVPGSDVAGASSLYLVQSGTDILPIWDGWSFVGRAFSDNLPIVLNSSYVPANAAHDVFAFMCDGVPKLGHLAWYSNSSRGTGSGTPEIEMLGGLPVNKNPTTLCNDAASYVVQAREATLVGWFCSGSVAGQTDDTSLRRLVGSAFNAAPRKLKWAESTDNWLYGTAAFRQVRGDASNKISFMQGLGGRPIELTHSGSAQTTGGTGKFGCSVGIGIDSSTVSSADIVLKAIGDENWPAKPWALYRSESAIGVHDIIPLERGGGLPAPATTIWHGDNANDPTMFQSGMLGSIWL